MTPRRQQLLQLLDSSPGDSFLLFALAKDHESSGESESAMAYYQELLRTNPDYIGLYYHLGKLFEKNQDFSAAVQTYKNGIRIAKAAGDQHAAAELSGALMELEDPDE
ncbi:MAG: tetratricopeptide repeat protein [Saprospiraceae bacterium]|nr:tetratricopeptide repeat protein [Saprospiraceae bacterium]